MNSLVTLDDLTQDDINSIIKRALSIRSTLDAGSPVERSLHLRVVANVFFEPSTRTQLSFDLASQRLGADVLSFNDLHSSTSKGETVRDTLETIAAMGAEVLVVRHSESEVLAHARSWVDSALISAGAGTDTHPTQALLDAVTLLRRFESLEGVRVAIVGDLAHSRVASSLCRLLPRLGADLIQVGPSDFQRPELGIAASSDLPAVLPEVDVVYLLRVQTERGGEINSAYVESFQLDDEGLARMKEHAVFMHPGPVNRGVEISDSALDHEKSLVLDQVAAGPPTRMAVLEWVFGAGS